MTPIVEKRRPNYPRKVPCQGTAGKAQFDENESLKLVIPAGAGIQGKRTLLAPASPPSAGMMTYFFWPI